MAEFIKVLIADGMPQMRKSIKEALQNESRIDLVGDCSDGDTAIRLALELRPDIVILDMNLLGIDGLQTSETLSLTLPGTIIIMTSSQKGRHLIKKAMAAGAREYLTKPFPMSTLTNAILSLYDKQKKHKGLKEGQDYLSTLSRSKVMTVFSTKGGVGKSTISTNLAVSLAEKKTGKVVLVDFDFQFGDIPIMLNLYPQKTIIDLVNEIQDLDEDTIEDYLIEHSSGLKVLPAPLKPEYSEYITVQVAEKILKLLLKSYQYIIIDTAPILQEINLMAMEMSDHVLVITTLELHTIKNVKSGLQLLDTLKYDSNKIELILNRFNPHFGISARDLENTMGRKILHVIPEDNATVVHSVNNGTPIVSSKPNSQIARSIRELAAAVAIENRSTDKPLLKRMFGMQ
jgi:pilus assembly protein CpaE